MKFLICVLSLATVAFANPELNHLCRNVPDNTFKVNPYNCNAYVTCLGGLAFEQFCQEGLFFDEGKQQCDYEANVNCDPSGQAPEPIDPSNPEIRPHPECIAAAPGSHLMLPHETDCTKFYMCNGNFAVTMTCPEPLHFNNVLKHCDFAQSAGCANF